jgi:hypothetical protein
MISFRPILNKMMVYLTTLEIMAEVANRLKEKKIFLAVRCGAAFRIVP